MTPTGYTRQDAGVKDNQKATVEGLYRKHCAMVFNVCGQRLRHEVAHDAAQEVWVRVAEDPDAIMEYEHGEKNALWRLAQRVASDMRRSLRNRSRQETFAQVWAEDENGEPELIDHPEVQSLAVAKCGNGSRPPAGVELWRVAEDVLPTAVFEALCMHYGHGLQDHEIAEKSERSVASVWKRLERGRKKIAEVSGFDMLDARLLMRGKINLERCAGVGAGAEQ